MSFRCTVCRAPNVFTSRPPRADGPKRTTRWIGRRIREDLGFKPKYPRLADAIAAGA
jgi:hypothetical protein